MIGNLTLDQLRVLVAIAETGSFSAAGRRLRRAQSAISQAVATIEAVHGVRLFDRAGHKPALTEVGRVLVAQARVVLAGAERFEAMAAATREGIEPELTVAIDPLVPTASFIESLRALQAEFPQLTVSFSTEGLGGAERRLRRGDAALAFCILLAGAPADIEALPLVGIRMVPVVAPGHPLARLGCPATRPDLDAHVQLVLSDPSGPDGPSYGFMGAKAWRFVELGRRLDFLLAGMGWCRMPDDLVAPLIAEGRLVPLELEEAAASGSGTITIHAARMANRPLGRAGAWLLSDIRARLENG